VNQEDSEQNEVDGTKKEADLVRYLLTNIHTGYSSASLTNPLCLLSFIVDSVNFKLIAQPVHAKSNAQTMPWQNVCPYVCLSVTCCMISCQNG